MGNKCKQDQGTQRHMNDYERSRMLRVQENQGKLREFGVKNIAKSLTSLVESKKSKKRKEKSTVSNDKDLEYIPEFRDDDEGDYPLEVSKSVGASKKVTKLADLLFYFNKVPI